MGDSKKYRHRSDDDTCSSDSDQSSEEESEIDDDDYERLRLLNIEDQHNLEQQFEIAKEILHVERTSQITTQLREVRCETAPEYVNPLVELERDLTSALGIAAHVRDFELECSRVFYDSENMAAMQNNENEKEILFDTIQHDLREKIRLLEEDRHNIDINSDIMNETKLLLKKRKSSDSYGFDGRKRKPAHISGPVIIYNLREEDIIEDWTAIKKAIKMKDKTLMCCGPFDIHYEGGKLFYEGDQFVRGDSIFIDSKQDIPVRATITTINQDEVWVKRTNQGSKSKLFISQLLVGKYKIRRCNY